MPVYFTGGSSIPGGSDTQVQFNDGGVFGGDSGLVFNKTTDILTIGSAGALAFSTDLFLFRDAARILAQRDGTNANTSRVYNTFTSATNFERFSIDWITAANTVLVGTEKGSGGGTARAMSFMTDATQRWQIGATTGHLLPIADATYSIGSSTFRLSDLRSLISVITSMYVLSAGGGSNSVLLASPSNGNLTLTNNGATDFGRLQLGGTTSSFPAIKRNAAILEARLADDSAVGTWQGKHNSSDGSAGVSVGPFTTITSITVKDGLVTALTGA